MLKWGTKAHFATGRHHLTRVAMALVIGGGTAVAAGAVHAQTATGENDSLFDVAPVQEKTPLPVVLEDLVGSHERVLAKQAMVAAAEERLRMAKSWWMPTLDATVQAGHQELDKSVKPDDFSTGFSQYSIEGKQRIYDFGWADAEARMAEHKLNAARLDLDKTRQELVRDALKAHFRVAQAIRQLQYSKDAENNIRAKTGMQETLVRQGASLPSDVLRAKKQLVEAQMARVKAENDLLSAVHTYKSIYGKDPGNLSDVSQQTVNVRYVPQTLNEAIKQALTNSLSVRDAELSVNIAREESLTKKAAMFPDLNVIAKREVDRNNVSRNRETGMGREVSTIAMLELSVPLFSGYRSVAEYRAEQYEVKDAQYNVADVRRSLIEKVRTAWQNLVGEKENAELLQQQAEIVGEMLRQARVTRARTLSELDVVDIETDFVNAVSDAVKAETDTVLAIIDLMEAVGGLRVESLSELLIDMEA